MTVRELIIRWRHKVDQRPLDRMGKSILSFKTLAIGAGAAIAGAFAAFKFAGIAGKFEEGIAKVGAVAQASAEELRQLEAAAMRAGELTQFSPTEAAEGLQELAQGGFSARQSMELLMPVLDLAAGGQIGVGQAAATTSAAVKVFGLRADEAGLAIDKMFRIVNLSTLKAEDMEIALGNLSRGAGLTKQSMTEMLAAVGLVKDTGVDASVAATAVSSALQFMAKNADDVKKTLGVVVSGRGGFRPFLDIVREVTVALEKKFPDAAERAAVATDLFGRFGVSAVVAIGKGASKIDDFRHSLDNAGGAAEEFRERLLATFEGQKKLIKGTLETTAIVIGKQVLPALTRMVSGLNKWLLANQDLIKQNVPRVLGAIERGLRLAAGAMVAIAGVKVIGAIFTIIRLIATWKAGVFALNLAIASNPIGIVVVATAAAVALMIGYWDKLTDPVARFNAAVDKVVSKLERVLELVNMFAGGAGFAGGKALGEMIAGKGEPRAGPGLGRTIAGPGGKKIKVWGKGGLREAFFGVPPSAAAAPAGEGAFPATLGAGATSLFGAGAVGSFGAAPRGGVNVGEINVDVEVPPGTPEEIVRQSKEAARTGAIGALEEMRLRMAAGQL